MQWNDLPTSFFMIGQYDDAAQNMSPLYFDLPDEKIAIPVWESKALAYSWLQGTFLKARYNIIEVKRDRFVPNLMGTRCACLFLNPVANQNTFPPETIFEIPKELPASLRDTPAMPGEE